MFTQVHKHRHKHFCINRAGLSLQLFNGNEAVIFLGFERHLGLKYPDIRY